MTKNKYYLNIARAVAQKSPCLRKRYGAVIVKDNEIIATGYNGPPRGEPHCETCYKAQIRDLRHENDLGKQIPSDEQIKSYKSNKDFEEYLHCRSVHAEMNAIISAARRDMIGSTLYLAEAYSDDPKPCEICLRLIKNAGIKQVITEKGVIYESENYRFWSGRETF